MDEIKRIKKDVELFAKNIKEVESIEVSTGEESIIQLARNYAHDTEYYLKKQDNYTAFGCITYAHGLLDAVRLLYHLI
ncbi:MAG TPA: DUF357 domain-containing protein [Methanobacterium sp.]|nr:DUF357 domain-containing protein [Methanobacterium sp.]